MPVLSERVHPEAELDASDIRLSGSDIPPEEENHPFPAELLPETGEAAPLFEADALLIPDDRFDDLGVYAYHLQVAQAGFVRFARANGGSPVSMLTALLSELIRAQFPEAGKDIVCGIPHQLRGVLGKPLAHDNLIGHYTDQDIKHPPRTPTGRENIAVVDTAFEGIDIADNSDSLPQSPEKIEEAEFDENGINETIEEDVAEEQIDKAGKTEQF